MKTKKRPMSQEAKELVKYIYNRYEIIKRRPYNPSFQKDLMLCNHLCNRFPLHWLKGLWDFYIKWNEPFVKDCGYTIGVFYSKINQMLELNIHRSQWVKKHEKGKMKSVKEVLNEIQEVSDS